VGPPASKLPAALEDMPKNRNPWKKIKDKETGLAYYWNQDTDETTSPGAARPRHWVQVRDKDTSGVYYWCPETDETTAIGEPRPSYDDDLARQQSYLNAGPPQTFGGSMKSMFLWGFGMSLAFGAVRVMLGG